MNKDNHEIEIKIKVANRKALEDKVIFLGGRLVGVGSEFDITFNNGAGDFSSGNDKGRHLRLRKSDEGNFLTYKESLTENKHNNILDRTEIETKVENYNATKLILESLGYKQNNAKEKKFSKYELDGFIIEFHTMPFLGEFIEIEAPEEDLKLVLPKLGLDISQGINKGYFVLFDEYLKANNLPINTEFTFESEANLQK